MPLDNCSRCGSLFKKISRDYCNTCYEEEEQLLRDTQAYLRDNRNASKAEVMSEMELDPETLEQWIESKRINEFDEA